MSDSLPSGDRISYSFSARWGNGEPQTGFFAVISTPLRFCETTDMISNLLSFRLSPRLATQSATRKTVSLLAHVASISCRCSHLYGASHLSCRMAAPQRGTRRCKPRLVPRRSGKRHGENATQFLCDGPCRQQQCGQDPPHHRSDCRRRQRTRRHDDWCGRSLGCAARPSRRISPPSCSTVPPSHQGGTPCDLCLCSAQGPPR